MAKKDDPVTETVTFGAQLLSLVGKIKHEDIADIDTAIGMKEKELNSLRAVRKVVALALGIEEPKRMGPKPKAKPVTVAGPTIARGLLPADERRKAIAVALLQKGPTATGPLAAVFQVSYATIPNTLDDHPWFEKSDGKYDLTPQGREAAKQLARTA